MNPELLCFPSAADVPDSDLGKDLKDSCPTSHVSSVWVVHYFIYLAERICISWAVCIPPLPIWWLCAHGHLNP